MAQWNTVIRKLATAVGIASGDVLAKAFFGGNAAALIGMRKGEPARRRLDAFYAKRGVPRPSWVIKVDGLAT